MKEQLEQVNIFNAAPSFNEYYEYGPKFNGVFSRKCLSKKGWAINNRSWCVKSIGTHQAALYINDKNVTYFVNFGVVHIPKKFIEKNIIYNK